MSRLASAREPTRGACLLLLLISETCAMNRQRIETETDSVAFLWTLICSTATRWSGELQVVTLNTSRVMHGGIGQIVTALLCCFCVESGQRSMQVLGQCHCNDIRWNIIIHYA